ncbi:MAG: hypothetical protein ACLFVQ_03595 [Chitinispirillaceae bacterium]
MIYPEEIKNETSSKERTLEEENRILEEKLSQMGAHFGCLNKENPEAYNAFLKHIIDCEESTRKPKKEVVIRSLFPENYEFPDPDTLDTDQLDRKIEDILDILEKSRIYIDLVKDLPDKLFYQYIVESVLDDTIPVSSNDKSDMIYNGCGGDCESCFQKEYCDVALENEELDDDAD